VWVSDEVEVGGVCVCVCAAFSKRGGFAGACELGAAFFCTRACVCCVCKSDFFVAPFIGLEIGEIALTALLLCTNRDGEDEEEVDEEDEAVMVVVDGEFDGDLPPLLLCCFCECGCFELFGLLFFFFIDAAAPTAFAFIPPSSPSSLLSSASPLMPSSISLPSMSFDDEAFASACLYEGDGGCAVGSTDRNTSSTGRGATFLLEEPPIKLPQLPSNAFFER